MISRRLLRIKLLQILFAYFKSDNSSYTNSEKELFFSINKTYELYHFLLILIVDIVNYTESKIDIAKQKRIPTYSDLNPNTKLITNKVVEQIRLNQDLIKYTNNKKLSWINYPELIKSIYNNIIASEDYQNYLSDEELSYKSDKKFIINVFEKYIATSELLHQILEEQSIYWNDDTEFVIIMIIKTNCL